MLGPSHDMVRVRQGGYEIDAGLRPGVTTEIAAESRNLKHENVELRRASEMLNATSVSFAKEFVRPRRVIRFIDQK